MGLLFSFSSTTTSSSSSSSVALSSRLWSSTEPAFPDKKLNQDDENGPKAMKRALQELLVERTKQRGKEDESDTTCGGTHELSLEMIRFLLLPPSTTILDNESLEEESTCNRYTVPFCGYPQRPLYVELTRRLQAWGAQTASEPQQRPLLDAAHFSMTELEPVTLPPVGNGDWKEWLQSAGNGGILEILGIRRTVGSLCVARGNGGSGTIAVPLLPPVSELLKVAGRPFHKMDNAAAAAHRFLSAAARERSKHAHRGARDLYFGIVQGGVEKQNEESLDIVRCMLQEAAWINVHSFASGDDCPVLEIRVAQGYGARWSLYLGENKVQQFRGFLEPQMAHGHEQKWRH